LRKKWLNLFYTLQMKIDFSLKDNNSQVMKWSQTFNFIITKQVGLCEKSFELSPKTVNFEE